MSAESKPTKRQMTWSDANEIAVIAMGREYIPGGKDSHWRWKADADPLAAWCLTELIHNKAST